MWLTSVKVIRILSSAPRSMVRTDSLLACMLRLSVVACALPVRLIVKVRMTSRAMVLVRCFVGFFVNLCLCKHGGIK